MRGYDKSLSISVGEAIDALHLCDAESTDVSKRMKERFGLSYYPDAVWILEECETLISAAAKHCIESKDYNPINDHIGMISES